MEALVRETKRRVLSLLHGMKAAVERKRVEDALKTYDADTVLNEAPLHAAKSVLFIITRFVRFHGGQTSVLRLGTQLAVQGFEVSYAVYKAQSRKEMRICAESNLKGFRGRLRTAAELQRMKGNAADIVIATSWDTVSFAKRIHAYRMYFVQDYEPYFYEFGELFLMAKKTYEQGLHMVSLGQWNKEVIERECRLRSPIDVIDFPFERKEYPYHKRNFSEYKRKKQLTFAIYMKYYGKRLPYILQEMMVRLKEELEKDGIQLKLLYFGEAKTVSAKGGTNLGMLSKDELYQLYCKADFGVLASLSNISLVSYEMLAAGLPMIEFEDGTFPYFFPEEAALLTSISYKDLYQKLKETLENPTLLELRDANAKKQLAELSWENTGKEMAEIIRHERRII